MDDYEELLNVIDSKKDLYKFLVEKNNSKCSEIEKYTSLNKNILGEGSRGKIYKQKIKGKDYAIKKFEKDLFDQTVISAFGVKELSLDSIAESYSELYNFDKDFLIAVNGGNPKKIMKKFKTLLEFDNVKEEVEYNRLDNNQKEIMRGYIFRDESYVEYAISVICSDFLKKGISINFLDSFGFSTCKNSKNIINDYFFMELINDDLAHIDDCTLQNSLFECLTVQLFHSLAICQTLKINHNDLSFKNVFLKYIDKDTEFNGEKLMTADYFHYSIGDKNIYFPYTPFIVKLGDFSMSCKYSYPSITNIILPINGYENQGIPTTPNWYNTYYDIVVFTINAASSFRNFTFMENLADFVLGIGKNDKKWNKLIETEIVRKTPYLRPDVKILEKKFKHVSPESVLFNKNIYGKYLTKPSKGKIITLGKI